MPFFRRSFAAFLVCAALPASAQERDRPGFWDVFTVENVATTLAHSALTWARLLADIRYDQVSVDPVALRLTLSGVSVTPYRLVGNRPLCTITLQRVTVNGMPLDRLGERRARIAADGVDVPLGCLPPGAAAPRPAAS